MCEAKEHSAELPFSHLVTPSHQLLLFLFAFAELTVSSCLQLSVKHVLEMYLRESFAANANKILELQCLRVLVLTDPGVKAHQPTATTYIFYTFLCTNNDSLKVEF